MNKKSLSILSLLIMLPLIPTIAQQSRGVKLNYLPSGKAYYNYQDSWAVLIGINKYHHWQELDYAVKDAKAIKDLLIEEYNFQNDHITILTDGQATLQNIKRSLGSGLSNRVGKNDRVLVYWAGHGQTVDLPTGGERGYLIPVEGSRTELYSTCLSMQDISELADMIPAKHVLFLVDACYSGLAANRRGGLPPETAAYLEKITRARGRQIITAGRRDEEVIEDPRWGHSVFTYKLIDGLKNQLADNDADGIITTSELFNYLQRRVVRESGYRQTPQYRFLSGDGEFVFITKNATKPDINILGMVYVRTEPWCHVFLDGKRVCESPYQIKNVVAGDHTIILRREGYKDTVKRFTISRNNRRILMSEILLKE